MSTPGSLAVVSHTVATYHRPNLHLGLHELLREKKTVVKLLGITLMHDYDGVSLAKLSRKQSAKGYLSGPVEYEEVQIADGEHLSCVKRGLYIVRRAPDRTNAWRECRVHPRTAPQSDPAGRRTIGRHVGQITVRDQQVEEAFLELTIAGGAITARLLGNSVAGK